MSDDTEKRWRDKPTFRRAARYVIIVIGAAIAVMLLTFAWAATNREECANAAYFVCASPDRYILALAPTAILLFGGLGAFVRTYQVWREGGTWPIWHGAGWLLFIFMLLYLSISAGVLASG